MILTIVTSKDEAQMDYLLRRGSSFEVIGLRGNSVQV